MIKDLTFFILHSVVLELIRAIKEEVSTQRRFSHTIATLFVGFTFKFSRNKRNLQSPKENKEVMSTNMLVRI